MANTYLRCVYLEIAGSEQQRRPRFTEGTKHMKGSIIQDDACSYASTVHINHEWQSYIVLGFNFKVFEE